MKRLYWIVALLLVFTLALAACGGGDEPAAENAPAQEPAAQAPAAEPTQPPAAPTETPTAVPTPEPTPEPALISLADLQFSSTQENLDSYRYEITISATGVDSSGATINQTLTLLMSYIADPPTMSVSMSATGDGQEMLEMDGFEMVQMGETTYMVIPEFGCLPFPTEGDLTENSMVAEFSPENIFGDLENLRFVGEEDRDGIRVLHYTFDQASLPAEDIQDINFLNGNLYIAKEGGFLVSMIVEAEGNAANFLSDLDVSGDATVRMEFNIKDINQPIEIALPEGCDELSADNVDFPILDDATDLFNMFGMVTYVTAVSVAEATEFYQNEMVALGYTYAEDESFILGSTAMLVFKNESGSVSVTISDSEGQTSVMIFAGE